MFDLKTILDPNIKLRFDVEYDNTYGESVVIPRAAELCKIIDRDAAEEIHAWCLLSPNVESHVHENMQIMRGYIGAGAQFIILYYNDSNVAPVYPDNGGKGYYLNAELYEFARLEAEL